MSSPSLFSDVSPRVRSRRNPPLITVNQHNRAPFSRLRKHKTIKEELANFCYRQLEGIPAIPYYLQNTVYAELLEQQYTIYTSIFDPSNKDKKPTHQELDALHVMLSKDNLKLSLALQDLRLPNAWDVKAKGEFVEISLNNLKLTYTGIGKGESDVSSTRANHAMRKQCGIYYFEIQIISKGLDGHIGIGFCAKINSLDRFPGWEEHSWGYHGENGNVYSGPGTGKSYGPKYGTGDVIGCGIDFRDMSAFYTKNGIYLGTAFEKIKDVELYPFVGFKTQGEAIEANFGSRPFRFDLEQFLSCEKRELLQEISTHPILDYQTKASADQLVMEYLSYHGYDKAAKALEKALVEKKEEVAPIDLDTLQRQEIRKALYDGDLDKVFQLCGDYYPQVLSTNPLLFFRLKCRKFMELVKRAQTKMSSTEYEAQSLQVAENKSIPSKREVSEMEIDGFSNKTKKKQKIDDISCLSAVMTYGNKLKGQYEEESKTNEIVRSELMTAFSTLAYADLSDPAVAYLFETPQIELVASELNSAILVSLGKYPDSSLERIYRQTNTAIELSVLLGDAKTALLQPKQDCF